MDKPLDIRQLSTCCGKPLVWDYRRCEESWCTCGLVTYDATCPMCGYVDADGMPSAERTLKPVEELLLARIAELEATLANERGEGDPPVPGWRYDENSGRWWIGDVVVVRPLPPAVGWRWGDRQGWDWQKAGSARDAMRAASAVSPGADAPKGE